MLKVNKKIKEFKIVKLLIILIALFIFISISTSSGKFLFHTNEKLELDDENDLEDLETSVIYNDITINDLPGSPNNWNWAKSQPWCTQGSGSQGDPYIIEDATFNYISGVGTCLSISNSRKFFILRNCTIKDSHPSYSGLYLENVTNGQIIQNDIHDNRYGITLGSTNDTIIIENNITSNGIMGISLWQSYHNDFVRNNVSENGYIGISIQGSYNLISENIINYNFGVGSEDAGIYLGNGSTQYNVIVNNTLNGNEEDGIRIDISSDNLIANNFINGSANDGIYILWDNNNVTGNIINNNQNGIYLGTGSNNNLICNNNISHNEGGIICYGDNSNFSRNFICNNTQDGIYLNSADVGIISGNNINNNGDDGVHLSGSNNFLIFNNLLNGSITGIYLQVSDSNNITGNIITNNFNGTRVGIGSDYNLVYNNSISENIAMNGIDAGSGNDWNSTLIGNYWSDYSGVDTTPKDGIADTSYNVPGPTGSKDHLPIFENPVHDGTPIHIDGKGFNALNWSRIAFVKWWCSGSGTSTKPFIIKELKVDGLGMGGTSCIFIEDSDEYFIIRNCTLFNSGSGVYDSGIKLINASNGALIYNNCSFNENGIKLEYCNNTIIMGNIVNGNDARGMDITFSNYTKIFTNDANYNSEGINLQSCYDNIILENNAIGNTYLGIGSGAYCYDSEFLNNTVMFNYNGLELFNGYNNLIKGNNASQNVNGIWFASCESNNISDNKLIENWNDGIGLAYSDDSIVIMNNLINNSIGILLKNSSNSLITNNTMEGCGIHFIEYTSIGKLLTNTIEPTNLVNNKSIYYYFNQANLSQNDFYEPGQIILVNCSDSIISNLHISHSTIGISFYFCFNNLVLNNTISYNTETGIYIEFSNDNLLLGNMLFNNNVDGIYVNGQYNTISKNTLSNNSKGIHLETSNNTKVSKNKISNNTEVGIYLEDSNDNLILGNMLFNNHYIGISLSASWRDNKYNNFSGNIVESNEYGIYLYNDLAYNEENFFYNNCFIDNNKHVYQNGFSTNYWNNSLIGNYWDNYTGLDTIPFDGIGDSPHNISQIPSIQDFLPIYTNPIFDGNPIHIDGFNLYALSWDRIAIVKWWCIGSGTSSNPYILKDLNIDGQSSSNCIFIENTNAFFRIEGCSLVNSASGLDYGAIKLENVNNSQLINNDCSNNNGNGIYLSQCYNNIILGNILNYNEEFGLLLEASSKNTVSGNIANNNYHGIYLGLSKNNNISLNTVFNNSWNGIYLSSSSTNNTLFKNNISSNNEYGIYVDNSTQNKIIENTVSKNNYGICLRLSDFNTISINIVYNNSGGGIYLSASSTNNTILNNDVSYNYDRGIFVYESAENRIIENTVNNNGNYGLYLWLANNNTLSRNNAKFHKYFGIIIKDGNYNTISQNNASLNGYGIGLSNANYSKVLTNIANKNVDFGIDLDKSFYNLVSGNMANHNNITGIRLWFSNNNTITENSANNNTYYGIHLTNSSNNLIANNNETINFNGFYGIYLEYSHYNNITKNVINYNGIYGIYLYKSNNNYITENVLIGNKVKAIKEEDCKGNTIKDNITRIGKPKFQIPLEVIILLYIVGAIAIVVSSGAIAWKRRKSYPRKKEKLSAEEKIEEIEKKEKAKAEKREFKEEVKLEKQKKKNEKKLQKKMLLVDNLIRESKIDLALKNLTEIEQLAKSYDLVYFANEAEQRIIECKKLELDTINRIKQTIINLGAKFSRLHLSDISEKSGIKNEYLIEKIIQEMISKKEIRGEYFASSKALALEVAAPVITREKVKEFNVFLSYSTLDADYFEISKIVRRLELYPEISNVYFWEADSGENIVTFMEQTLKRTNVFVLFCSENSIKSKAVEDEWQAAFQLRKEGLMKMVPVYEKDEHVPYLLKPMLNVKFTKDNFDGFIQKLYEEILR